MLKSLRQYAENITGATPRPSERPGTPACPAPSGVPPIIWETNNIAQIRSLLVVREAELVVAKAQLTGNRYFDWHTRNRILDLELKIADLRKWLNEAMEKKDGR